MGEKQCKKCLEVKSLVEFYCQGDRPIARCKQCTLEKKKQQYQTDENFRAERRTYQKIYSRFKRKLEK